MPTTRTRIERAVRSRVTDEARAIFNEAIKLEARYRDCNRKGGTCRSTSVNRHCAECAKYFDLRRELSSLLGTKPWKTCPLDAVSAAPPDYMRARSEDWQKARALRFELDRSTQ